jgi:2-succinyl-5-enolpyruvyl-6-hydroxy-3-cyclohexene-1-carboxylate synthase
VSQRGINGIDGLVSGAIGSAASANKPGLLLLGDVSFVHDVSGLQLARELKTPFVVLVVDNAGGRIFDDLPLRAALETEPGLNQFWRTPPQVDFAKLTEGFGVRYRHVTSSSELTTALAAGFATPGLSLVHATVEPGSGRALSERWRQLRTSEP